MWANDSTYRGIADGSVFHFKSPLNILQGMEDEFSMCWIHLSDSYKAILQSYFKEINESKGYQLPRVSYLSSYDNPAYLWLSSEIESVRQDYNKSLNTRYMRDMLITHRNIPYVQLFLKSLASSIDGIYPCATLDKCYHVHTSRYVIEFDDAFLKHFINFIFYVFDDNPQLVIKNSNSSEHMAYQFMAPVYRLPPFAQKFDTRHDIPGLLIHEGIQMLIYHELAHIGRGHLDFNNSDPSYKRNDDIKIAEEDAADEQAVCWLLSYRFAEANENTIEISASDLMEELATSVLAAYLVYTWQYAVSNRSWDKDTISQFGHGTHLPDFLRAYRMMKFAEHRLRRLANMCAEDGLGSADGHKLDQVFFDDVISLMYQMIDAFEKSLRMFFAKTMDLDELLRNRNFDAINDMIKKEQQNDIPCLLSTHIPWMLGITDEGKQEIQRIERLRNEVSKELSEFMARKI